MENKDMIEVIMASQKLDGKRMIGICKDCGKIVYEGEEGQTTPTLSCKICVERNQRIAKERIEEIERRLADIQQKKEERVEEEKSEKIYSYKKGLINSGIIGGGIFLVGLLLFGINNILTILVISIIAFVFRAQLSFNGAVCSCCTVGIRLTKAGFSFALDPYGILLLWWFKLLVASFCITLFFVASILGILFGILISPFTFIPAIMRVRKEGL